MITDNEKKELEKSKEEFGQYLFAIYGIDVRGKIVGILRGSPYKYLKSTELTFKFEKNGKIRITGKDFDCIVLGDLSDEGGDNF